MALYEKGSPHVITLEAEKTVFLCQCGLTGNAPFCDGSHSSTDKTPLAYTAEKSGDVYLCGCGKSSNIPFCDGSHNR